MTGRGVGFYLMRRLLTLIPLAVAVTLVVFLLVSLVPGGPIAALVGEKATSTEAIAALTAKYHLDEPLYVQYFSWLVNVLQGDLGQSIFTSEPVAAAISSRLPLTLTLNIAGIVMALIFGVSMGTAAALRRGRPLDRAVVAMNTLLSSAPSFVVAIVALYVLGLRLRLFPIFGTGDGTLGDWVHHLVLPAVVLSLGPLAFITRITRAAMLDELERDHVAFGRARGLSPMRIVVRYGLRNALIPIITASGLLLIGLLTGTVFVETVFGLPGLGGLLVTAINNSDIPVIQGVVLMVAVWIIFANIVTDVLYVVVDPRVDFSRGRS